MKEENTKEKQIEIYTENSYNQNFDLNSGINIRV